MPAPWWCRAPTRPPRLPRPPAVVYPLGTYGGARPTPCCGGAPRRMGTTRARGCGSPLWGALSRARPCLPCVWGDDDARLYGRHGRSAQGARHGAGCTRAVADLQSPTGAEEKGVFPSPGVATQPAVCCCPSIIYVYVLYQTSILPCGEHIAVCRAGITITGNWEHNIRDERKEEGSCPGRVCGLRRSSDLKLRAM